MVGGDEPDPLHPKPCPVLAHAPEQTVFCQKLLVSHQLSLSMNYLKLGKNSFPLQIVTPTDSFVVVQLPCRPLYLTHKTVRLTLTCCLVVRHEQNSDLSSSQIQGRNGEILSFWGNCCPR